MKRSSSDFFPRKRATDHLAFRRWRHDRQRAAPARYALHKLIVFGEREGEGEFQSKSKKSLMQSGLLLSALKEDRAWEVEEAWADLLVQGKGWSSRARRGLTALDRKFPEEGFGDWLQGTRKGPALQ